MHRPFLTPSRPGTTFGAEELDFRVRDGIGYFLFANDTPKNGISYKFLYLNNYVTLTLIKQDQIKKNPLNIIKAKRQISIGQLKALLLLHPQPIKLLV